MSDDDNYEPQYYEAVAKVQALFAGAPTPGEVVRAIERLGWAPREFVINETIAAAQQYVNTVIYDRKYGHDLDWVKDNLRQTTGAATAGLRGVGTRLASRSAADSTPDLETGVEA